MSFNIIDMVKDQLSDQVVGALGGMLGGNADQSSSAISAAIPGLLGSLTHAGSTTEGAKGLFDAINGQDDSILNNLGDALSGDKGSSLASAGSSMLSSVLGDGALGGLTNALSGFSGASKGGITSMLGMFAPMIFGMIKRKLTGGSDGFNVGSLMNMLNGQKSNVAAAMPSGFADKFNFSGVEDAVKSNVNDTINHAKETVHETAHHVEKEGGSLLGKLLPLALLAGGAYIAYNMFMGNKTDTVTPDAHEVQTEVKAATDALPTIDIEGLGKDMTGTLGSLTSSFGGITDVDSAKAALPNIEAATGDLGKYAGLFDKIPEAARGPIVDMVTNQMPLIQAAIDKISEIPGVGALIKPVAEGLMSKLALFK